jgi:hypothetical protein
MSQNNNKQQVIGYRVSVKAFQAVCQRLAQLPYSQVADVFQLLDQESKPIHQAPADQTAPNPGPENNQEQPQGKKSKKLN